MILHCRKCFMPSTRPRIVFDEAGVCNACHNAEEKQRIDWEERKAEFLQVIADYRGDGPWDCVVPFSGGKDSAAIAWRLKFEYGLNPLLATYGQLMWTDVGRWNFHKVAELGFDIIYWRVNQEVSRKLARRFLIERGCPKIHYNAGVNAVPLRTAIAFNIPLVMYAEHGESEYGGLVLDKESQRTRNLTEVLEHQIGDDPRNWATDGISERELTPYIYPNAMELERVGVKAFYWSYFHKWDIHENYELCREKFGFQAFCPESWGKGPFGKTWPPSFWGRSDGTFTGWDSIDDKIDDLDFYMMHIKFSFGRATRMAARLIQGGHLTREQGLALIRRYDGEAPYSYRTDILDYIDMDETELTAIIDAHRNPEIWRKEGDEWHLRHPPA